MLTHGFAKVCTAAAPFIAGEGYSRPSASLFAVSINSDHDNDSVAIDVIDDRRRSCEGALDKHKANLKNDQHDGQELLFRLFIHTQ